MFRRRWAGLFVAAALCLLPLAAGLAARGAVPFQKPQRKGPPADAGVAQFKADVDVVNISFVVRDRKRGLVAGLGREDFTVFEDGLPQDIKFFSTERDSPLSVGILIDSSPSQSGLARENMEVAAGFLKRVLRESDRAFIVVFDRSIRELCPPTNDASLLARSLLLVLAQPPCSGGGCSAVLDAIYRPALARLKEVPGRKALIMIGDGKDNGSVSSDDDVVELLQRLDVIFYGLDNGGIRIGNSDRETPRMSFVTDKTGGRVFDFRSAPATEAAFQQIEEELRAMYSLGYYPASARKRGFRKVSIRPRDPSLRVRARPGYNSFFP